MCSVSDLGRSKLEETLLQVFHGPDCISALHDLLEDSICI